MNEEINYDYTKQWRDSGNACVNWIGTIFARPAQEIKQKVSDGVESGTIRYVVFQSERCPTSGKEHQQIFLQLSDKKRLSWLKNFMGSNQDHWEPARHPAKARNYCRKDESRIAGPFEYGEWAGGDGGKGKKRDWTVAFEEIESLSRGEHMRKYPELWSTRSSGLNTLFNNKFSKPNAPDDFVPNGWQAFLEKEINGDAGPRRVIWVYDSEGNSGKTSFGRYLASKRDVYFTSVAAADRNYFAYDGQNVVIYDIPRSTDDATGTAASKFPYQQLEKFKDGNLPSGMFGSAPKHFKHPHVIVFANFEPNIERLTTDRWFIIDLSGGGWKSGGPILSEPVGDGPLHGKRVYWGVGGPSGSNGRRNEPIGD